METFRGKGFVQRQKAKTSFGQVYGLVTGDKSAFMVQTTQALVDGKGSFSLGM